MIFYVSFILLVGSSNAQNNVNWTRCDQHPKQHIEYKWLKDSSPMYVYRSQLLIHKCAQVVYVGPDYNRNDIIGSGIIIQGSSTYSYELNLTNNTVWETVLCPNGLKAAYSTIYTNFNSQSASFCAVNCADDGLDYIDAICFGRSPADEVNIQKFLDSNLKGVPGIINQQSGCTKPKNCDFVIN